MFITRNLYTTTLHLDPDAKTWINAVEDADSSYLEQDVKRAMNKLVLDMKNYSLWYQTSSMTVRMGARTLAGALIDIKSPNKSWTNNNFVSADYNRITGLLGDGSTKYLYSGITNNLLPQNDRSIWEYLQATASSNVRHYAGGGRVAGGTDDFAMRYDTATTLRVRCLGAVTTDANANAVGLIGMSRTGASEWISRGGQADQSNTQTSAAPGSQQIIFYATGEDDGINVFQHSDHRGRGGAIGSSIDLATMESVFRTYVDSVSSVLR